ncbi:PqiB family protein [Desulfoluna spongiiphila]|uniref:PqiB family protein n=1 Tax=Desulfoluna spongiiphila TaxID=419481 RepID=UPI0012552C1E|nr:MlaD family protein [Desulfoluna spongiiphila]VVS91662.1 mce/mlad [Desulfoluna spongiiphila]
MNKAVVKTKKSISPVWILPLIALMIGGWLVLKSVREAGYEIAVRMEDAVGITPGKTQVLFKGIPVGMVNRLVVSRDLLYVDAIVEMKKESREHIVDDTKFWVVRPEVSVNQISGLDTIVSGSYIGVLPGSSETISSRFIALHDPPTLLESAPGLHLTLQTPSSSMHEQGAPVLFKKIQVGEVLASSLGDDAMIRVDVLVYKQYEHLVTSTSYFWDVSGIQLKANLPEVSLKIGTFKSMFAGGVQFATPPGGKAVAADHTFPLYRDAREARQADDVKITLHMPPHRGVNIGAEITYRNVTIGEVKDVNLAKDMQSLVAVAGVSKKSAALLRKGTYIWVVSPEIGVAGIRNIDSVIKGSYLKLEPGTGKRSRSFTVYEEPPVRMHEASGLNLVLESETLGSLKKDRPVTYRQVKVGHVTGSELSENRDKVYVYINIYKQFADLVSSDTRFWNVSGIRIQGGLMTKMKISSESFEALVAGGIAFATPETEAQGKQVKTDHHFVLHKEMDEAWREWLAWDSDVVVTLEEKE